MTLNIDTSNGELYHSQLFIVTLGNNINGSKCMCRISSVNYL